MSNEHGRRLSKRLAAAAATDYEHDDDFSFVRKSKRTKTVKTDRPKPEAVLEPKAEPVKKSAKGRPAAKHRAAKAPTTNETIVEEEAPEKGTSATIRPATRKSSRRKGLTRRMTEKSRSLRDHQLVGARDDLGKHRRKKPSNQRHHSYQNPSLNPNQKQYLKQH
ncbi:hypothetical protein FOMA001_g20222 [Fusarium oxysporum f. sp. matthiolae]|nr:hypothetical protein FOMA001_g20222 [Fusarium oxysporum f. sp. matthiolae]